jgi:hypothetical protein
VPKGPGVYAVWATPAAWRTLSLPPGKGGVLYVGRGDPTLRRRFREEWRPKTSGRSSPRRTLGALLKDRLELHPVPRRDVDPARGARYYCFAGEGEGRLTEWSEQNLLFACHCTLAGGADAVETELVQLVRPPLNLTKWPNPEARRLRELRKHLEAEALGRPPVE